MARPWPTQLLKKQDMEQHLQVVFQLLLIHFSALLNSVIAAKLTVSPAADSLRSAP